MAKGREERSWGGGPGVKGFKFGGRSLGPQDMGREGWGQNHRIQRSGVGNHGLVSTCKV